MNYPKITGEEMTKNEQQTFDVLRGICETESMLIMTGAETDVLKMAQTIAHNCAYEIMKRGIKL